MVMQSRLSALMMSVKTLFLSVILKTARVVMMITKFAKECLLVLSPNCSRKWGITKRNFSKKFTKLMSKL